MQAAGPPPNPVAHETRIQYFVASFAKSIAMTTREKPTARIRDLLEDWPVNAETIETDPQFPHIHHVTASTGERYVLKDVGGLDDTISPLGLQHRVTQYLHRSGVRVAYLLTTRSGGFHASDGSNAFILLPRIERESTDLYADDAGPIYYNVGRAYANLHQVLAMYDGQIDTWETELYSRLFEVKVPRMRERMTGRSRERLEVILSGLEDPIADVSPRLVQQPVLWDCHLGNTLLHNGQVSGFVDCDHISVGPRICDLANFAANLVARDCSTGRTRPWLRHLPRLLEGYGSATEIRLEEETAFSLGIPFFLLTLVDHFQEYGPRDDAEETFECAWWVYDNLGCIQAATEEGCSPQRPDGR